MTTVVLALALGLAAGVLSGLFGVGGGILFVPTLVVLGLGQVEAQATSLLAIIPTVAAGAWNQRRYGHLRAQTALVMGLASVAGVEVGARIATTISAGLLRQLFGVLLFLVAAQLAIRAYQRSRRYPDSP